MKILSRVLFALAVLWTLGVAFEIIVAIAWSSFRPMLLAWLVIAPFLWWGAIASNRKWRGGERSHSITPD